MVLRHSGLTFFSFVLLCGLAVGSSEYTVRDATIEFDISPNHRISLPLRALSSKCGDDMTALKIGLLAREIWALRMIDAASKLQSGLLEGNIRDLGVYDECVGIRAEQNPAHIQGRHCMISVASPRFSYVNHTEVSWEANSTDPDTLVEIAVHESTTTLDPTLTSSVCVPSTCDPNDIAEIVNTIFTHIPVINALGVNVSAVSCSKVTPDALALGEILTITLLGIAATFIISSTLTDLLLRKEVIGASGPLKLISQFSILKSTAVVFNTKTLSGMIPAVHGIRFLSICWIVMGDRCLITLARPLVNLRDVLEWVSSWGSIYLLTAPFAVDVFFVISGFLVTHVFLNAVRSGQKINVPMMYLQRYLRLTPAAAIVMLFTAYLLPRMGSGALWEPIISKMSESCKDDWWQYLLFIQNHGELKPCMVHTWYLAADMQLFIISPLILYPLHRWPKWGLTLLWSLIVASTAMPTAILGMNRYTNVLMVANGNLDRNLEQFRYLYIPSYCRATAYLIGIFLGYEVVTKKRTLSKIQVRINWIVTCCLLFACSVNLQLLYHKNYVYNIYREIVTAVVSRLCWPIGISWTIYACTQGYGGPVTKFLSLPLFLPLSRLSYCVYLIHFQFQLANTALARTAVYFTGYHSFVEFWSDLPISFALAIVLTVFVESPVRVLANIISGKNSREAKSADLLDQQLEDESREWTADLQA